MTPSDLESRLRAAVVEQVRVVAEGHERFRVFTPFLLDDGDHLCILLRREGDGWAFTDEGHTYMHLTYGLDDRALGQGTRHKVITQALNAGGVEDRDGEWVLATTEDTLGDALFSFIQALLRASDVVFLNRERVRSAFADDLRSLIEAIVPPDRATWNWHDGAHDPGGKYLVDCRINGLDRPVYLYGVGSDAKARDVTISLLQFERIGLRFRPVVIFEEQEAIQRQVLARLSDVCEKMFSSLHANDERIRRYLTDLLT